MLYPWTSGKTRSKDRYHRGNTLFPRREHFILLFLAGLFLVANKVFLHHPPPKNEGDVPGRTYKFKGRFPNLKTVFGSPVRRVLCLQTSIYVYVSSVWRNKMSWGSGGITRKAGIKIMESGSYLCGSSSSGSTGQSQRQLQQRCEENTCLPFLHPH